MIELILLVTIFCAIFCFFSASADKYLNPVIRSVSFVLGWFLVYLAIVGIRVAVG